MKYPRASGAPDPTLKRARFAHMTLLHTIGNLGLSRSGPPPRSNPGSAPVLRLPADLGKLAKLNYRSINYICSLPRVQPQIVFSFKYKSVIYVRLIFFNSLDYVTCRTFGKPKKKKINK